MSRALATDPSIKLVSLALAATLAWACTGNGEIDGARNTRSNDGYGTPTAPAPTPGPTTPPVMTPTTPAPTPPATTPPVTTTPTTPAPVPPVTTTPTTPVPAPLPTGPVGEPLPRPNIRVSEAEFPPGVYQILERRCGTCHTYGERDPAGWGSALDLSRMIASDVVVPGNPDASRLYNRVAVRADMPYNGARLSSAEVQTLRAWIANLQRPAPESPRSQRQILDVLVQDQNAQRNIPASDLRYLSFAHFADERRAPEELQAAEAVLSLTLNSLSRRSTIVKLEAVDAGRTVFRFRLSALGWGQDEWDALIALYPYCLRSDQSSHRTLYQRLGTEAPYVRADWFLATATRPPLYERLLDIPDTLDVLADELGVDINRNINHPGQTRPQNVMRIGFRSSGVSAHNRIMERHSRANGGYLWVSYDFNSSEDRADIRENPLGPDSRDERNFQNTFIHAGGEVIYSLPNGLQAYLLVDAAGNRIELAPKDIVRDPRRRPGAVENGVSCFGCHGVTGMNYPRAYDEIVKYAEEHRSQFPSIELTEIRNLYPTNGAEVLLADANRYLAAKDATGGARSPFGVVEYDDFINLVGQYEAEVGMRAAAIELETSIATVRQLVQSGRNEDQLPLTLADPLVSRDDFVCRYRSLAPRVVRNATFCAGTFTDADARARCQ
jgi:mono/diheme cytochrome c family protein